mmetsp:Transcript_111/g.164  ORF Transcript_111/g.164 Transcript_111/m.164 type:complete len:110 (+) Transcript_111:139-468(+)
MSTFEVFPLNQLPDSALVCVFSKLQPLSQLVQASCVCRLWALVCEAVFQNFCRKKGWVLPRSWGSSPVGAGPGQHARLTCCSCCAENVCTPLESWRNFKQCHFLLTKLE